MILPCIVITPYIWDLWGQLAPSLHRPRAGQSALRNGANITVDALNSHRESYITEYDFAQMASLGIQHGNAGLPVAVPTPAPLFPDLEVAADAMDCRNPPVRLPVGWWVFASSPLPVESTLLPDPCYPEQQFVTVSAGMMDTLLRRGQVGQQRAERSLRAPWKPVECLLRPRSPPSAPYCGWHERSATASSS